MLLAFSVLNRLILTQIFNYYTDRNMKDIKNTPCWFHVGRGGRFHNQGHRSFEGVKSFDEVVKMRDLRLFVKNRGEKGRFVTPYLTDCNGKRVSDYVSGDYGVLDFDGNYDTDIVKPFSDCDDYEREIIYKALDKFYTGIPDEIAQELKDEFS